MIGVVLLLANYQQENSPKKGIYNGLVVLPLILSTLCGVFGMFQKTDRARCILSSVSLVAPLALGWCIWQTRKLATGSAIGVIYLFIVISLTGIGALNVALSVRCGNKPNNRNRSSKSEGSRIVLKSKKEMIELNVLKSKAVGSATKNDKKEKEKNDDLEHSKAMENHDVEALLLNKHRPRGSTDIWRASTRKNGKKRKRDANNKKNNHSTWKNDIRHINQRRAIPIVQAHPPSYEHAIREGKKLPILDTQPINSEDRFGLPTAPPGSTISSLSDSSSSFNVTLEYGSKQQLAEEGNCQLLYPSLYPRLSGLNDSNKNNGPMIQQVNELSDNIDVIALRNEVVNHTFNTRSLIPTNRDCEAELAALNGGLGVQSVAVHYTKRPFSAPYSFWIDRDCLPKAPVIEELDSSTEVVEQQEEIQTAQLVATEASNTNNNNKMVSPNRKSLAKKPTRSRTIKRIQKTNRRSRVPFEPSLFRSHYTLKVQPPVSPN
ncbi:hypothetical protein M3Y94_01116900 [Aphelenchoides besseyi]|nr:hypothetical protein M3Y94_01116900 [Aphelenchoides besseyi]